VDDGTLATDATWQLVSFDAVNAKQVKFQVVNANADDGNKYGAAAEIRFTTPKEVSLEPPTVSLAVTTNEEGRIVITGTMDKYNSLGDSYVVTAKGLLYIPSARIGTRTLTVNTSGRTKVNFTEFSPNGSFIYNLKPTNNSTAYAFRAFITYKNTETGKSVTVYSNVIRGSYNTLK
jgi:hypothetical protein